MGIRNLLYGRLTNKTKQAYHEAFLECIERCLPGGDEEVRGRPGEETERGDEEVRGRLEEETERGDEEVRGRPEEERRREVMKK